MREDEEPEEDLLQRADRDLCAHRKIAVEERGLERTEGQKKEEADDERKAAVDPNMDIGHGGRLAKKEHLSLFMPGGHARLHRTCDHNADAKENSENKTEGGVRADFSRLFEPVNRFQAEKRGDKSAP